MADNPLKNKPAIPSNSPLQPPELKSTGAAKPVPIQKQPEQLPPLEPASSTRATFNQEALNSQEQLLKRRSEAQLPANFEFNDQRAQMALMMLTSKLLLEKSAPHPSQGISKREPVFSANLRPDALTSTRAAFRAIEKEAFSDHPDNPLAGGLTIQGESPFVGIIEEGRDLKYDCIKNIRALRKEGIETEINRRLFEEEKARLIYVEKQLGLWRAAKNAHKIERRFDNKSDSSVFELAAALKRLPSARKKSTEAYIERLASYHIDEQKKREETAVGFAMFVGGHKGIFGQDDEEALETFQKQQEVLGAHHTMHPKELDALHELLTADDSETEKEAFAKFQKVQVAVHGDMLSARAGQAEAFRVHNEQRSGFLNGVKRVLDPAFQKFGLKQKEINAQKEFFEREHKVQEVKVLLDQQRWCENMVGQARKVELSLREKVSEEQAKGKNKDLLRMRNLNQHIVQLGAFVEKQKYIKGTKQPRLDEIGAALFAKPLQPDQDSPLSSRLNDKIGEARARKLDVLQGGVAHLSSDQRAHVGYKLYELNRDQEKIRRRIQVVKSIGVKEDIQREQTSLGKQKLYAQHLADKLSGVQQKRAKRELARIKIQIDQNKSRLEAPDLRNQERLAALLYTETMLKETETKLIGEIAYRIEDSGKKSAFLAKAQKADLDARKCDFESSALGILHIGNPDFTSNVEAWEAEIGKFEDMAQKGASLIEGFSDAVAKCDQRLAELDPQAEDNQEEIAQLNTVKGQLDSERVAIDKLRESGQYSKVAAFKDRQKVGGYVSEATRQLYNNARKIRKYEELKVRMTDPDQLGRINERIAELSHRKKALDNAFTLGMQFMRRSDLINEYPDRSVMHSLATHFNDMIGMDFNRDFQKTTKDFYLDKLLAENGYSAMECLGALKNKITSSGADIGIRSIANSAKGLFKAAANHPHLSEIMAGDIGHAIAIAANGDSAYAPFQNIYVRLSAERKVRDILVGRETEGEGAVHFDTRISPELAGLFYAVRAGGITVAGVQGARGKGYIARAAQWVSGDTPIVRELLGAGGGILQHAIEKRIAQSAPLDTEKYISAAMKGFDIKGAVFDYGKNMAIAEGGGFFRRLSHYGWREAFNDWIGPKAFKRWWKNATWPELSVRAIGQVAIPLGMTVAAVTVVASQGVGLAALASAGGLIITGALIAVATIAIANLLWRHARQQSFNDRNHERLMEEFKANKNLELMLNQNAQNLQIAPNALRAEFFASLSRDIQKARADRLAQDQDMTDTDYQAQLVAIQNQTNDSTKKRRDKMRDRLNKIKQPKNAKPIEAEKITKSVFAALFGDQPIDWSPNVLPMIGGAVPAA